MTRMRGGFWQQVLESDMTVPATPPLNDLTAELVSMLGSLDPVERSGIAYPVLATWLASGVYDDLLVSFGDGVATGLTVGLGEPNGERVFRRTFSALILAGCVTRDNAAHLLPVDAVVTWADRGLTWLVREVDLRGFVPQRGWAHAVAHGADLIGALARNRHFNATELTVLLDVIADRLVAPTAYRLAHGEDGRLAYATMTILHRDALPTDLLEAWVSGSTPRRTGGHQTTWGRGTSGQPPPSRTRDPSCGRSISSSPWGCTATPRRTRPTSPVRRRLVLTCC